MEVEYLPYFRGRPNAFTLELCAALPDHEHSLFFLFQAAFECFPDRDYCVLTFPPTANFCYVARHFVRVPPRNRSTFAHELYSLHKNAVLGKMSVRVAVGEDKADVGTLLESMVKTGPIEELFKEAVDFQDNSFRAFAFLCEDQLIGCAVATEEAEHEYLEIHYGLESWVNTRHNKFGMYGHLENFVLAPMFQRHQAFFLREIHRLTNFYVLFSKMKRYEYMYSHKSLPILGSIASMMPVLPKRRLEYDRSITDEFELPAVLMRKHQAFALYMTTSRLLSAPRIEVNHRLVVIGAGDTSIAFLESLLFSKNARGLIIFANVTVISPHGICYHKQPNKIREMVFVSNGHLDRRHIDSICLKTYVHVVTGVMTSINRKEKFVVVNDDSFIPYDYLFLLCGTQFQKPPKKKDIIKRRSEFPLNVFIINTEADAGNAFNTLRNLTSEQKEGGTIVVYGHYLESCCCLAALLEYGVSGNRLTFIDPSPDTSLSAERHDHLTQFFNNKDVETAVTEAMLREGITIYQDYNFSEWHLDPSKNTISSAKFESKYKLVEIDLSAMFIYHSKSVSARTFGAMTRCGLVFNGALIIDKEFQTNDPCIFGAGPLTRYSSKYHADHLSHKFFNGEEVGYELGQMIRRKLVLPEMWDYEKRKDIRRQPIVQHCRFPGNLNYLYVSKPGRPVPLEAVKIIHGKVLITGNCKHITKKGYFRIHFDQYNTVQSITCLAKFELNVQNLISLYGKHESILNNMMLRYDMKMITDLYDYFKEPWICAIYNNKFPELVEEFDLLFQTITDEEGKSLIEEIKERFEENNWHPLNKLQTDEIEEVCRQTDCFKIIERKLLHFLHENYMYLPMYAHQLLIRWIVHQIGGSPLFVKTKVSIDEVMQNQLNINKGGSAGQSTLLRQLGAKSTSI